MVIWPRVQNLVPSPLPVPDFDPVPRKYRYDGWTPERQRAFIAALAELGSVRAACKQINMSQVGAYYLRRQPGADSFRAAWEAALDHGVQRLADIAIDRAIEGVAVPVYWRGEQVGEKRWYNDRLLMFILKHHMPNRYGANLPPGTRHPDTIAREAAEHCPVCKARAEAEAAQSPEEEEAQWLAKALDRYEAKVRVERQSRLAGDIVGADYTLRQLTYLELILDCGGKGMELIDRWLRTEDGRAPVISPMSAMLDRVRREAWATRGEPRRPPLRLDPNQPRQGGRQGGPTIFEREKAQCAAEARMAHAQAEWEAAATEEGWAAWVAERGE
jgi:hypothetical protein